MRRLAGRRVVVTGGAWGIGAAIVRRFAAEGARIAVLDGRADAAVRVAAEVGGRALAVDLADGVVTREVTEKAVAGLGGVDVLVNTAGILRSTPLLEMDLEEWDEVFAVNTRAMLVTTQVTARAMIADRTPSAECAGKIVNLASTGARVCGAGQAHHAASTAAVVALTRAAARELGPHGITVNCLCPGYVAAGRSPASRTAVEVAELSARSPLGRLAEPEDVAAVALFLASSDSDYLTGDTLDVPGGMVLR